MVSERIWARMSRFLFQQSQRIWILVRRTTHQRKELVDVWITGTQQNFWLIRTYVAKRYLILKATDVWITFLFSDMLPLVLTYSNQCENKMVIHMSVAFKIK